MLQPNKRYIDDYLKSNVDELGELSTALRNTMIDEGMPYEVIRLEKLTREME